MTIDVTIASTAKVFNAYGQRITGSQALDPAFAHSLIMSGQATPNTPGQHPPPNNAPFDASGAKIVVNSNSTLSSGYIGATLVCTAAITLTIPEGLPANFSCIVQAPPAGNVTIAVSGNAQINGAQTPLTRSLASNANGFAIQPAANAANSFLVGGA